MKLLKSDNVEISKSLQKRFQPIIDSLKDLVTTIKESSTIKLKPKNEPKEILTEKRRKKKKKKKKRKSLEACKMRR